jgi:hypothetical protein
MQTRLYLLVVGGTTHTSELYLVEEMMLGRQNNQRSVC